MYKKATKAFYDRNVHYYGEEERVEEEESDDSSSDEDESDNDDVVHAWEATECDKQMMVSIMSKEDHLQTRKSTTRRRL